jgi:SAM-dependent methyltransferase
VLDVGAGSCPYRHLFAHCEYRAQDFTGLQDEQLRYGGYGKFDYVSDAAAIPVPNASFDAVLCTEVLEHVPELTHALDEFKRLLKSAGVLIIASPFCSLVHMAPYHYCSGFSKYWYEHHLALRGFEINLNP